MEMTGTRAIPAPAERVWHALNDPETLKTCVPGCESIEVDGENGYRMVVAAKVGPVSARFTGKMRVEDVDAPRAYTLRFEGSGGAAGFANGEARVTLTPTGPSATTLDYAAKAQIGGKLAQVGSRLIDGVAQKLTDDFFTRFVAELSPPVQAESAEARVVAAETPTHAGRGRLIAAGVVVVAVLLGVLYFVMRGS